MLELLLNLDTDVKMPAITFKNANIYWKMIMFLFISGDTLSSLGLSTAKPPTPVIDDIMIQGYMSASVSHL